MSKLAMLKATGGFNIADFGKSGAADLAGDPQIGAIVTAAKFGGRLVSKLFRRKPKALPPVAGQRFPLTRPGGITRTAIGVAAGAIGGEQLAEMLGVRGGAGFVGACPPTSYLGRLQRPPRVKKDGGVTCRKRPAMNPLNPRALRRSMRRVGRFAQFAKRTISFTKRCRMKKRGRRVC